MRHTFYPVAAIYLPMMPRFWAYCNSVILSSKPPRCKHFLPILPMGWQVKCIRKSYKGSGLARDTPLPSCREAARRKGYRCSKKSRCTKSAAALRGVTSQPALCDDPPHTGQVDPTQQMLQYDQHGILLSDRPFQPNSPFSKNRSSLVKLPPPKRLSSGPRP